MPHAHDQYLQTAAELGIAGLAAGVVAFACVGWLLFRAVRGVDEGRRRWAWASTFGLVFLALDIVVDVHTIATVAILVAIPIAVLDATSDRVIPLPTALRPVEAGLRRLAFLGLAIATLAALVFLGRSESVALRHQEAVIAAMTGDWASALEPANAAADADPDIGSYQLLAGLAAAGTEDWEAAEARFRRATAIDDLPAAWVDLAAAQVELGRPADQIRASLDQARRLGDQQATLALAIAELEDRIGETDAADAGNAMALLLEPSLAGDPAWRSKLGEGRYQSVIASGMAQAPRSAWEIALMSGDASRARELAQGMADPGPIIDVVEAWDGDRDALARVHRAADASPQDAIKLAYAARVSAHAGDDESARRYVRLARLGPGYSPWLIPVAYGARDLERDGAVGMKTPEYGTYTYRRPLAIDLLAPGLPGLTLLEEVPDESP
jgi:hypothetical protein